MTLQHRVGTGREILHVLDERDDGHEMETALVFPLAESGVWESNLHVAVNSLCNILKAER